MENKINTCLLFFFVYIMIYNITYTNNNFIGGSYNISIPKIIHIIWFGNKPDYISKNISSWFSYNTNFTIWLWTHKRYYDNLKFLENEFTENFKIKFVELINENVKNIVNLWLDRPKSWGYMHYGGASDFSRIAIIKYYGGYYTDLDNKPNKILDWGTKYGFFLLSSNENKKNHSGVFYPSFIAGTKNHIVYNIFYKILLDINYNFLDKLNKETKENKWACIADLIAIVMNEGMIILAQQNPIYKYSVNGMEYTLFFKDNYVYQHNKKSNIIIGSNLSKKYKASKCNYIDLFYKSIYNIKKYELQ